MKSLRSLALVLFALLALAAAPMLAAQDEKPATIRYDNPVWKGDFDGMVQRREIRALVPYSKTIFFVDQGGTQRGLSYEFLRAFEEHINRKLKRGLLRVNIVFIPVARDQLIPWLADGRGDIAAANLSITPGRQQRVDFTEPLATGVREILVTGPGAPELKGLDDLAGRDIFVRRSSSYREHLEELNGMFRKRGLPEIVLRDAPDNFETEDMLEMVNAGLYQVVVADEYLARFWANVFKELRIRDDIVLRSNIDIAFAVRKGSPLLKAELDPFVKANRQGSALGNTLIRRYLVNTSFVRNATTDEELRKFRGLVKHFKQYSERYNVDWVLMAAQGYQESGLNQEAKSAVGAIGVMQLMPATGKDMKLDITQTETNIHAGVKYVRWVIDNFYADQPMTDVDKMLFAFASYNAGPGRVRGLRREAEKRGLDPNVWFHNVEHVAAEKIGRETVQYVSNIYKYYIAYTLVEEQSSARRRARDQARPPAT
jgi:membrane-bound lytic murein transglycosylase MltF